MRAPTIALLVILIVALQVTLFPRLAYDGVVPNLVLLLVVAAALVRGPEMAAGLGFLTGLAVDLAPPADHIAGRWALALVVVGYVAGRVRHDAALSPVAAVATVAASSFVGTSIFELTGLALSDPAVPVADVVRVLAISVLYDVAVTPFVLPPLMRLLRGLQPRRVGYQ